MNNPIFDKAAPLLSAPAPALQTLLQGQIDMLNSVNQKFGSLDLSAPTKTALACIIGGQQPQSAIAAALVLVKDQAQAHGLTITEYEANVIAQAVTTGVLGSIQVALTPPTPVSASQPANETGNGAGTATSA